MLLLFESVILLGMGLGAGSRSCVLVRVASLILNGLAQFQPAFGELPRFVQIGLIGTTLLGGDLVALLLRERMARFTFAVAGVGALKISGCGQIIMN